MVIAPPLAEPDAFVSAASDAKEADVAAAPASVVLEPRRAATAFPAAFAIDLLGGFDLSEPRDLYGASVIHVADVSGAKEGPVGGVIGRDKPAERAEGRANGLDLSFDVAVVSDYRRGGVSRSDHDPALQVSFDVDTPSGWSAGVFVSTIAERKGASVEVNLYGAKTFEFGDTELSLGALALIFPGGEDSDFGIAQASVSTPIGPIDATLAVNYAWEQPNLDNEDNLSVTLRGRTRIGRLAGIPLTLGGSVGHSEGHLAIEGTKMDWSLSLTADFHGFDVGISYVDTDLEDERGDPGCIISIAHTF